jgi:hypothetical protein
VRFGVFIRRIKTFVGDNMRAIPVFLIVAAPLAFAQTPHGSTASTPPQPDASGALPGDDALTCDQIQAQLNSIASNPAFQSLVAQQQAVAGGAASQAAQHPELAQSIPEAQAQLGAGAAGVGGPAAGGTATTPNQGNAQATDTAQGGQPEQGRKKRGLFKGVGKAFGSGIGGAFGADRAAVAAQQRQIEAMGKAGREAQEANKPLLDAQAAQLSGMSPQMMRGMHLMQIGQAKGCSAQPSAGGH